MLLRKSPENGDFIRSIPLSPGTYQVCKAYALIMYFLGMKCGFSTEISSALESRDKLAYTGLRKQLQIPVSTSGNMRANTV